MKRDDIISMAREAGFVTGLRDYAYGDGSMPYVQSLATSTFLPELERFAALVAAEAIKYGPDYKVGYADGVAAEREACAKVCDDFERAKWESVKNITENGGRLAFAGPMHCAAAIRARGQQ